MVGQRFVQLLHAHPWFEITALAASERSTGKRYREACRWLVSAEPPAAVRDLTVLPLKPDIDCQIVFSALPGEVAGEIEAAFAAAGYPVFSNARTYRMAPDVPLLIPEVNPEHIEIIPQQRRDREWKGFIVTNPNCSAVVLTMVLKPLYDRFGLTRVSVTTFQALSGAGYPGVPSLEALDNVIPYIGGEEEKLEIEPPKMLGRLEDGQFLNADFSVSAQCNRVAVRDGHFEAISVELDKEVEPDEVIGAFADFSSLPQELGLPSAPKRPLVVRSEPDRPQSYLDRDVGAGMSVVIGRVRRCPVLDYKFVALGHNTIRGAAGGSVLNAELLHKLGYLNSSS